MANNTQDIFVNVTIKGQDFGHQLIYLQVDEADGQADMAILTFGDSSLEMSSIFREGMPVEIDLGWNNGHTLIFRGQITGIRHHFRTQGNSQVEVEAMNSLIRLGLQPKTKRWWNTTISQIVRDIATANQFTPGTIEPTKDIALDESRPYNQIEETDLAFLLRLAQDFDSKLYVDYGDHQDTLNFVATSRLMAATPIQEQLVFNDNLTDFFPAFDAFATVPAMRLVTTDPVTCNPVEISQTLVDPDDSAWVPDPKRMARLGDTGLSELWAKTVRQEENLQSFWQQQPRLVGAPSRDAANPAGTFGDRAKRLGQSAQGRASGSIGLRPRRPVVIKGCGGRWSKDNWYLAEVKHEINVEKRSYVCAFTCTR